MRYSGIQPQYFPRLHYFARILNTDVFVIRDDCQFVRKHKYPDGKTGKSYQAHTPIKFTSGIYYLSLPVSHEGLKPISETKISYNNDWIENQLKTIQTFYSKSPNFSSIFPEIKEILTMRHQTLAELNISTIFLGILRLLGRKRVSSNKLSIESVVKELKKQNKFRLKGIRKASLSKAFSGRKNLTANEKILTLIKEIGADEDYCGGTGVTAYMNQDLFQKHGIKVTVQDWKCKKYPQLFVKQQKFIPNLSIIDLLMNTDHSQAVKIIKG